MNYKLIKISSSLKVHVNLPPIVNEPKIFWWNYEVAHKIGNEIIDIMELKPTG